MYEKDKLVVCAGNANFINEAQLLANKVQASFSENPGEGLTLLVDEEGVSLNGFGLSFRGDFEQMLRRISGGHLQHEMLAHVAKTKLTRPYAVDATAGMGEDSIILAACGYEVTLFEQNPVIAALLADALSRAKANPDLCDIVGRMRLIEGNSMERMPELDRKPDLIYLDPMFPARQKSGLINKKLQLIQKLEHPCVEEERLLLTAFEIHPAKVVIKRPLKGPFLAEKNPNYSIKGKAIRYDCFVFPDAMRQED